MVLFPYFHHAYSSQWHGFQVLCSHGCMMALILPGYHSFMQPSPRTRWGEKKCHPQLVLNRDRRVSWGLYFLSYWPKVHPNPILNPVVKGIIIMIILDESRFTSWARHEYILTWKLCDLPQYLKIRFCFKGRRLNTFCPGSWQCLPLPSRNESWVCHRSERLPNFLLT